MAKSIRNVIMFLLSSIIGGIIIFGLCIIGVLTWLMNKLK
jgi:hypothetical protein